MYNETTDECCLLHKFRWKLFHSYILELKIDELMIGHAPGYQLRFNSILIIEWIVIFF